MPVWPVPYCKHFNPANKTLKHGADSLPRLIRRTAAAVADTAAPAPALGLQNKKKTAAVFKRFVCRMWCVHIIVRYIYTYMYAQGCCCRSWSSFSTALTSRWRTSQRRTGAAQKLLTIKRYPFINLHSKPIVYQDRLGTNVRKRNGKFKTSVRFTCSALHCTALHRTQSLLDDRAYVLP